MAYSNDVPNQSNTVRGASGDLVAMQANFALLEPVVLSGLSGLSGVDLTTDAPAEGNVLSLSGDTWVPSGITQAITTLAGLEDTDTAGAVSGNVLTYDGADWVDGETPAQTLSGLTDTAVSGAVSGNLLEFDGTDWVPYTNPGDRAASVVRLLVDQSITGGFTTVTGFECIVADPLYTLHTSGLKMESSGKVDIRVNALYDVGVGVVHRTRIQKNGLPLGDDGDYGLDSQVAQRIGAASAEPAVNVMAIGVPVVSGDVISFATLFDTGTQTVTSGQLTGISVQDNAQSFSLPVNAIVDRTALFSMASGAAYPIANDTRSLVSGITETQYNYGGFTLSSGTITVPTGSGYTHIDIQAQALWGTSGTPGDDIDAHLYKDGSEVMLDAAGNALDSVLDRRTAGRNGVPPVNRLATSMVPVSGGETFDLRVQQVTGGVFDLLGGAGAKGVATHIKIKGHKLPAGGAGSAPLNQAALFHMVSGDSFSVADGARGVASGITETAYNTGGFTVNSGTVTIPTGSGYTHVSIDCGIHWGADADGDRDAYLYKDGSEHMFAADGTYLGNYLDRKPTSRTGVISKNSIVAPYIPVSGGEAFTLQGQHTAGNALDMVGGGGAKGGLTYIKIMAHKLTDPS